MQLSIKNLCKTYNNGIVALDNVSLEICNGLFGLLGPNGAGKSTLMRTIATLQEADSGEITLGEIDVLRQKMEVKKILGYLPQNFGFYPKDNAFNLLEHFTLLKGVREKKSRRKKVTELLQRVNLWEQRKQKLGSFSNGMRQRFGIALALLGHPKLIIVDEPTAGLDPAEQIRFHNLLSEIGENIVVVLSTHIVDDVSDLCANMAIIDQGQIVMQGSTILALTRLMGKIWEKEIPKSDLLQYQENYNILSTRLFAGKTFIRVHSDTFPENGFYPGDVTLQDVYFYHLKKCA
ncbi:ABC transporter ATP-binding protein [candidate division KSB1 bacterium]|nr:ABC transporter ATP-binding protein [candidate division KSB1 bacterium]